MGPIIFGHCRKSRTIARVWEQAMPVEDTQPEKVPPVVIEGGLPCEVSSFRQTQTKKNSLMAKFVVWERDT
jgi:hypothetical protein